MKNYFLAAIGAALGGIFRYWMSGLVQKMISLNFPLGTLTVNILGSFILGILLYYFDAREFLSPELKVLLTVGFCGGFTTFSTFSVETVNLLRDSEVLFAFLNMGLSLFLSLAAVVLAFYSAKIWSGG